MRLILFVLVLSCSVAAQVKRAEEPAARPPYSQSLQAVVVTTKDWLATTGTARLFERRTSVSRWKAVSKIFSVSVGRTGMSWGDRERTPHEPVKYKSEGDGTAPAGMFPLTSAFGGSSKPRGVDLPYTRLDAFTECVDDTDSSFYNRIVNRLQVGNFDWKSSEKMLAVGEQYDLGLFVAYNSYPTEKARGSCIFLHVWKGPANPTEGCTAMDRHDLEKIVAWASSAKNPYLIQMPEAEYRRHEKGWKLPELK